MATIAVFVSLFGIGFATIPATLAVKDLLGVPWFVLLLIFSIVLTLGGGVGGIYWFVTAQELETAGERPWLTRLRGALGHRRTTMIDAAKRTGRIRSQLVWLPPLMATAFILTLWLVAKSSKGNEISGTLSVLMSIVSLGIAVFLFQFSRKQHADGDFPKIMRLAAPLTAIALGVSSGFFYWTIIHKTDIPVTDRVVVSSGQGMQNRGQATIHIPGVPPQRSHLALIPTLTNPVKVGDCVNPAQLDVTPVIDGEQRRHISVRPGNEVRLDLTGVTHQASVVVTLHEQDSFCMVNLSVGEAILYN